MSSPRAQRGIRKKGKRQEGERVERPPGREAVGIRAKEEITPWKNERKREQGLSGYGE